MPARVISLPFVIAALVFLYMTWEVDEGYSIYIVPQVLALALIYIFSPQINWWWYKKNPPELDQPVRQLFQRHIRYYQELSPDNKKLFRNRVALYMIANEFTAQATEEVPEDIKAMIAASAVQITFGFDDFLLSRFERIIVYPRPFPSPQYPNKVHASEIYEEDGVIIFSAEQLARGVLYSDQFYNIGLHEYAKVFRVSYPELPWPVPQSDVWEKLEQISGFKKEAIYQWINLDDIDPVPVSVAHFFVFPYKFQIAMPDLYKLYVKIFNQDPALGTEPVIIV